MKKILISILMFVISGVVLTVPAFAASNCILTSVLGNAACDKDGNFKHNVDEKHPIESNEFSCSCDSGDGDSMLHIISLVVDIMTIGIGILGVIGISIVGTQYLTAGGNEEKTRKAKRRMFEIVIGLVAYVILYAALRWLMPNMP